MVYFQAKGADTGAGVCTGKKTEPKLMIDNPNAAATKTSNLIRPKPLKVGSGQSAESKGRPACLDLK